MTSIRVFTDGSCMKRPNKKFLAGYGIYFPDGELENISRPFTHEPLTNQRAELYAICKALYLITSKLSNIKTIIIYSDSDYSIKASTIWAKKWVKNNWNNNKVKNQDIIRAILKFIKDFDGEVKFIHVYSHTGKQDELSIGNEQADLLATNGANKIIVN